MANKELDEVPPRPGPVGLEQLNERSASVVYVAGYGRSGSTVLGTLLGSVQGCRFVGELCFLAAEWSNQERKCSCGLRYPECKVWARPEITAAVLDPNGHSSRIIEKLSRLPRLLLGWVSSRERQQYRRWNTRLLSALGTPPTVLIDTSKTARGAAARPLALKELAGVDVRLIHLTRDGRSCLESLILTGGNWALENKQGSHSAGSLRATVGWLAANLVASVLGMTRFRGRYVRIRFEDLLSHPECVIQQLGSFLDMDVSDLLLAIRRDQAFEIGHVAGGNRLRFLGPLRLRAAPTQDRRLGRYPRLVFALLGGWLNRAYGY